MAERGQGQSHCLLTLLCVTVASAVSLPAMELDDHIRHLISRDGVHGYDFATLHAVDPSTNEERAQTKRDVEAHAADPSSDIRRFSLLMTSGQRLRMSVARRSVVTSDTRFTEITEDGEREITFRTPRDCFFGGDLEGEEEGLVSLALCDGQVSGRVMTDEMSYEIHPISEDEDSQPADDVKRVLVTWHEGETSEEDTDDGIEIPDGGMQDFVLQDELAVELTERTVRDKRMTIEIANYVDKNFVSWYGKSSKKTVNYVLSKWHMVYDTLKNKSQLMDWTISLQIVQVTIMQKDPSWYRTSRSDDVERRLQMICRGLSNTNFDQITLHTWVPNQSYRRGLAYMDGVCTRTGRCAAINTKDQRHNTELHELGHNLGLRHDHEMRECNGQGDGFMDKTFAILPCYAPKLNTFFRRPDKACIFKKTTNKKVKLFGGKKKGKGK